MSISKTEKKKPLGICDMCGKPFPEHVSPYNRRGQPRLCCSRSCTAALNSRNGAAKRGRKQREKVRRGEWVNPSPFVREDATDADRERYREKMGATVSAMRKREVKEGTWRNPALSAEAREKLSRPRTLGDNLVLHQAVSKLSRGMSVADLTTEEANEFRAYRRRLEAARRPEIRAWHRQYYHRLKNTAEGKSKLRQRWQRERKRVLSRPPNRKLRQAREEAGLTQAELARRVGVSASYISRMEMHSAKPKSHIQACIKKILGDVFG